MDASDIYYSDNSQLIESNNEDWIDNTVLIENDSLAWQDNGEEITVNYSNANSTLNQTLTDNDAYLTAQETDDTDASRYFSILETNDSFTDNMPSKCTVNVEVEKEEVIVPDKSDIVFEENTMQLNLDDRVADDEVILYRSEMSDELFGIQIADDGNGNLQKYKFKVRQNTNGQFEAIPGTMEVEKAEIDEEPPTFQNEPILQPPTKPDPGILLKPGTSSVSTTEQNQLIINKINPLGTTDSDLNSSVDQDDDYQTVDGLHVTGDSDEENMQIDVLDQEEIEDESMSDDSLEDYEIEELEEAFQDDKFEDSIINYNSTAQVLQHKSNIGNLKISPELIKENNQKRFSYLLVSRNEKENRSNFLPTKNNQIKMRSILKSNNPATNLNTEIEKTSETEKENTQRPYLPSIISTKNNTFKSNTFKQEKTVPNKSVRQPRKQIITPVLRDDSEIIVQPLIYSVGGEENEGNELLIEVQKRKRFNSEVYQISDESDPDYSLKPQKRKSKYLKKRLTKDSIQITIIDSDDEPEKENVIEVLTDQEDSESESETESSDSDVLEINETEPVSESEPIIKNTSNNEPKSTKSPTVQTEPESNKKKLNNSGKNKCPHCPKTFPRLITLKKHLNVHSIRRSLRSSVNTTNKIDKNNEKISKEPALKLSTKDVNAKSKKFNCVKCKLNFMSEGQYNRHRSVHFPKKQITSINSKVMTTRIMSPRKKISVLKPKKDSIKISVLSKKQEKINQLLTNHKCEICGASFAQERQFMIHKSAHKTFPCIKCKVIFKTKVLLDEHLRKNCVRFPIRKLSPKVSVKCEQCGKMFPNHKSMLIHTSVSHKRRRSSNIGTNSGITIIKTAHSGVPVSLKMQQALEKTKQKFNPK